MFRFALTAYLSMAAILAPMLCCCALEHTAASKPKTSCCGKSASTASTRSSPGHAHNDHSARGHRHRDHAQGELHDSKTVPARVPTKHDPDSCPCDKHFSKLVAVPEHKSEATSGLNAGTWVHLFNDVPLHSTSDALDVASTMRHHFLIGSPASLAGRDLLRAYHILRC